MKHGFEGMIIGFCSGLYVKAKTFGIVLSQITWSATLETAYYAAIGAVVGGLVSMAMKWMKKLVGRHAAKD